MKIIAIIPSRFQSSRFPGKPLALINNKPMVQHVYEKVKSIKKITDVYVATDDERISNKVRSFGGEVVLTSPQNSGADRVFQAYKIINKPFDLILNIQGDEPLIKVSMINDLISVFENDKEIKFATLKHRINDESIISNPNVAKVVTTLDNFAIYFSRSKIPYNRDFNQSILYYKHIGIYAYTPTALEKFCNLPQSKLEIAEQLEQLRFIENGYKIYVKETNHDSIGVDNPSDIEKVEKLIRFEQNDK